jgi:hypothetical protein
LVTIVNLSARRFAASFDKGWPIFEGRRSDIDQILYQVFSFRNQLPQKTHKAGKFFLLSCESPFSTLNLLENPDPGTFYRCISYSTIPKRPDRWRTAEMIKKFEILLFYFR